MATCEEEIDFREEAKQIIADIGFAVENISISTILERTRDCVHINLVTLEGKRMCVQLNTSGLKVVGSDFDVDSSDEEAKTYESIYALLDCLSPAYVQKFGEKLAGKLAHLPQE